MHTPSASLPLALVFLTFALPVQSAPGDWKKDTVLVSPQDAETVVRHPGSDTILYKNSDPQLAIEWGMANARNTVVLAGKYLASERCDEGYVVVFDPKRNVGDLVDPEQRTVEGRQVSVFIIGIGRP